MIKTSEWFYSGSPSLAMNLNSGSHLMTLYLHPQWMMKKIARPMRSLKPKVHLEEALSNQRLQCQVDLTPLSLKLNDVINLRVGDVIKTDHKLTDSLLLKHKQQAICPVELGETNLFKSIQIASSL